MSPPFRLTYTVVLGFCTVHYVLQLLWYFSYRTLLYASFSPSVSIFFFFFDWLIFFQFRWVFVPALGLSAAQLQGRRATLHCGAGHSSRWLLFAEHRLERMGSCSCGRRDFLVLWPVDSSPARNGTCVPLADRFLICCTTGESCLDCFFTSILCKTDSFSA